MTGREKIDHDAEELVRSVTATVFGQRLSEAQVRLVAKKVSAAVPEPASAETPIGL